MTFTDESFLFYFLPASLVLYRLALALSRGTFNNPARHCIFALTAFFYGFKEPWWLIPLFICIGFDFLWATILYRVRNPTWRKALCGASIAQNIALLAVFKYENMLGLRWSDTPMSLPPGISFYTFESLSFVIDVYRQKITPPRNPLNFFAFIGMFPRFLAGPIVRYRDMAEQFTQFRGMRLESGLYLFLCGLFLKTCFADSFAVFVPMAFDTKADPNFLSAWLGTGAYAMQIYFDFSGYSLMAIGLGQCLGFDFPMNFNRPYLATSLREFWKRWHISLSSWFRDYLYIPLGGNQKGPLRTYFNLLITMGVAGLWHGAGLNFVIWGLWHGVFLCFERAFFPAKFSNGIGGRVITMLIVLLGWVWFRAENAQHALQVLSSMASPSRISAFDPSPLLLRPVTLGLCAIGVFYCFWGESRFRIEDATIANMNWARRTTALVTGALALTIIFSSRSIPFLYFRF